MFAWMDEWFKRTWIVLYLEAYGLTGGAETIPTRQLWHNETSPEQCFGLLAFDQTRFRNLCSTAPTHRRGLSVPCGQHMMMASSTLRSSTADDLTPADEFRVAFDTYLATRVSQLSLAVPP